MYLDKAFILTRARIKPELHLPQTKDHESDQQLSDFLFQLAGCVVASWSNSQASSLEPKVLVNSGKAGDSNTKVVLDQAAE